MWKYSNFHGSAMSIIASIEIHYFDENGYEKHQVCVCVCVMPSKIWMRWTHINVMLLIDGGFVFMDELMVERNDCVYVCLFGMGSCCQCHAIGIDMAPRFLRIVPDACLHTVILPFIYFFHFILLFFCMRLSLHSLGIFNPNHFPTNKYQRTKRFSSGKW